MERQFDVIIVGGSYSGLAAAMALGRALRRVLVIDAGKPCNRQTPFSHNFITQDGERPAAIAAAAKHQVSKYDTVTFLEGEATEGFETAKGFGIRTGSGETFGAKKLIFATGIKDLAPAISGWADCWGISVLHCPYCHGYEVRNLRTGVLGNGESGFAFSVLISNWTSDLTLLTNGKSTLTSSQMAALREKNIPVIESEVERFNHIKGYLQNIVFRGGATIDLPALYVQSPFEQHCLIPQSMGCALTEDGYLQVDTAQKTTVHGIFACGDNASRMRTVANAVAMGTTAGMMANREIVFEQWNVDPWRK